MFFGSLLCCGVHFDDLEVGAGVFVPRCEVASAASAFCFTSGSWVSSLSVLVKCYNKPVYPGENAGVGGSVWNVVDVIESGFCSTIWGFKFCR